MPVGQGSEISNFVDEEIVESDRSVQATSSPMPRGETSQTELRPGIVNEDFVGGSYSQRISIAS